MDPETREQVAIILIVVLLSGCLGYIIAYIHFQPQIEDLWMQILNLQDELESLSPASEVRGGYEISYDNNTG